MSTLNALWQKYRPQVEARVALLERFAQTGEDPHEALETAHKLAGSLGMFGFPEGSAIARKIEQGLEQALEAGSLTPSDLTEPLARLRALLFSPI